MSYLERHKDTLVPEFRAVWAAGGSKSHGPWEEVFGRGPGTDEIFMTWHFARHVNRVAEQGRAAYRLPMYVNAALIRPGCQPGQYPSAGPVRPLIDVLRAGRAADR